MSEIMPCPFCGSNAKIIDGEMQLGGDYYPHWEIHCTGCPALMMGYHTNDEAKEEIINNWNKRVTTKIGLG